MHDHRVASYQSFACPRNTLAHASETETQRHMQRDLISCRLHGFKFRVIEWEHGLLVVSHPCFDPWMYAFGMQHVLLTR